MERMRTKSCRRRASFALALALAAGTISACGEDDYKNDPRPPGPINVTAFVSDSEVSVSPAKFGAGPIVLIVTNQSAASQDVVLESEEEPGKQGIVSQSTGPINPQDTASLKVNVPSGHYVLKVKNTGVKAADLVVGPERESAQNQVLLP
jgi:hypothetical protein